MPALYIHIPFCLSKCHYCSFSSWAGMDSLHSRYVTALLRELEQTAATTSTAPLTSVFIGGGTPTILTGAALADIVKLCRELFGFASDAEISIEANPGTVDLEKLTLIRASGINRLSLGVQSFHDAELQRLGRPHSADDAACARRLARMAGFDNINLDLMYGLPGQSPQSWQESLEQAFALAPTHLSLYELSVEEGTPFQTQLHEGRLALPEEEELSVMDEITANLCRQAGFIHYEISNYARPGCQCRHNINYWENGPYLGLGAAAVSCIDGRRQQRISEPLRYCELIEGEKPVVGEEEWLEPEASFRETVIMGLRMTQGVSRERLRQRYNMDIETCYGPTLTRLMNQGLLELSATTLRLTSTGRRFANQVMAELV